MHVCIEEVQKLNWRKRIREVSQYSWSSVCAPEANRSACACACVCVCVCDKGLRVAMSHVMLGLITSENHVACAGSACYKSTHSCPLQASSLYPGCVLASIPRPAGGRAGPRLSDAAVLRLHWSTAYPGKLDQWETFWVLVECLPPICRDLFLEGLIGRGRRMSEDGTVAKPNDPAPSPSPPSSTQPFLSHIPLLSSCSFTFLGFSPVCRCLAFTVF